jgi:hypothetical protein
LDRPDTKVMQSAIDENRDFTPGDARIVKVERFGESAAPTTPLQWLWQQAQAEWKA